MPRLRGMALLLFASVLTQSGTSWANNDPPQDQNQSSHIALVRAYALRDFHQSLLDRLSGSIVRRFPYRMVSDSKGRILVTDAGASLIHVFDVEHGVRSQIGGSSTHRLNFPGCIAVDAADNVYVTDRGARAVLVFNRDGRFLRTIGAGALLVPTGLAVDKQSRTLYVADWLRGEILAFDLKGNFLHVIGGPGFGPGELYGAEDIILHQSTLVVLDRFNYRFDIFDLQGQFLRASSFGLDQMPVAFAFDGEGNLFYVDLDSGALVAVDPQGRILARTAQLPVFDQRSRPPLGVGFMCLATDLVGGILAVGPTLDIETLKVEADKPNSISWLQ